MSIGAYKELLKLATLAKKHVQSVEPRFMNFLTEKLPKYDIILMGKGVSQITPYFQTLLYSTWLIYIRHLQHSLKEPLDSSDLH